MDDEVNVGETVEILLSVTAESVNKSANNFAADKGRTSHRERFTNRMEPSIYSSGSSTKFTNSMLHRRKVGMRASSLIPVSNEVKQRVISAKLLRMKQIQNQLNDARQHIAELTAENRLLKAIHKRQDSALAKYENSNADLPALLNSHAEEIRVLQARCRALKQQNKDLNEKIKQKDAILLAVSDQNKHLMQLNKDRNLEERERLTERLKDLEQRLMDKDNDAKLLARRLQLEVKSFKIQLQQENQKYRECYGKLERAHAEIARLNNVLESNNLKGSPTFQRAKLSRQVETNKDEGDKQIKPSPARQKETRFLSPIPKTSDHGSKTPSPKTFKSQLNGTQKTTKKLLPDHEDVSKQERPEIKPNRVLDSNDEGITDDDEEEFAILPPLKDVSHKSHEILEHKKHIEEIENKMLKSVTGNNNVRVTEKVERSVKIVRNVCQEPSPPEADFQSIIQTEQNELEKVKMQLRENIIKKENLLDEMCDEITKGSPIKKSEDLNISKKRKNLDASKKTQLLAALKAIEGNESFEKLN